MGKMKKHILGRKGEYFSEQLRGIDLQRILVIAIDAAKYHQKALICNYFGDVIEDPFFFTTNLEGNGLLLQKIKDAVRDTKAVKVFIGIESTGHYYEEVVRQLQENGYTVSIINPLSTKQERAASLNWCKTDDIDLGVIAYCIIHNKVTLSKLPEGIYAALQTLTRTRRTIVKSRSCVKVKIRVLMDSIWREFQGYPVIKNGKPKVEKIFSDLWGHAPIFLMQHYPLPDQILALGKEGLRQFFTKHKLRFRAVTIEKLIHAASIALKKSPNELQPQLLLLSLFLEQLKLLNTQLQQLEHKIEALLVQTEGVLLITTPKVGVLSAAEFIAEVGPINRYTHSGQIIKKAGTNAMVFQSGGGRGYYTKISKQGNKHLRSVVFTLGKNLSHGNDYFEYFYQRLKSKGKHTQAAYIAVGNKFIKVAFAMLRKRRPYLPPLWEGETLTRLVTAPVKDPKHAALAAEKMQQLLAGYVNNVR